MKTYAILPVKELGSAKSRLSPSFSEPLRRGLLKAMLADVLTALEGIPVIVISPEDISEYLAGWDTVFLQQSGGSGLDHAVKQANKYAMDAGADSTLFIPADMPLINPDNVREVLSLGNSFDVVITQANDGGTGILFRRPPDVMDSRFTANSFDDHIAEARKRNVNLHILDSLNLSLDIDTADDISCFMNIGEGENTRRYLKECKKKI